MLKAGGRALALIGTTLAGAALGWAALTSAISAALAGAPRAALPLGRDDPRAVLFDATLNYAKAQKPIDAQTYAAVLHAAGALPQADEPFVLAATRAVGDGDNARATRLLEEARERNPRGRLGRLLLLVQYLKAGRVPEAVEEMGALNRLVPEASGILVEQLARLAMAAQTREAVTGALKADAKLANAVLERMSELHADPALVEELAERAPPQPVLGVDWRSGLLAELVSRGDYARARDLWGGFNHAPATGAAVFDEGLHGTATLPPFAWEVVAAEAAGVDWHKRGGLSVEYYGRRSAPLVRQLVVLAPGRYRLQSAAESAPKPGRSSALAWTVTCKGATAPVAQLPITSANGGKGAVGFAIPASGCGAQYLSLDGVAGDLPEPVSADLTSVSVRPEAGR